MKHFPIGVLQGRLTPSNGRGIQFFPDSPGEWEREFELAPQANIDCIQWVCNKTDNPLFDESTRALVRDIIARTRIRVRNMDVQLLTKLDIQDCPDTLIEKICSSLADINGGTVELPLMEASSLLEKNFYADRVSSLFRFLAVAERHKTPIAVETDLPPKELAKLLDTFPSITAVYDTGNSAGMGYDMPEEIAAYGTRISNVHIKDKPRGGATVPLGTGSVDFPKLFQLLGSLSYTGLVTLQAARGQDGEEIKTIKQQIEFVQQYAKYL